jgi:hypothetical protein
MLLGRKKELIRKYRAFERLFSDAAFHEQSEFAREGLAATAEQMRIAAEALETSKGCFRLFGFTYFKNLQRR